MANTEGRGESHPNGAGGAGRSSRFAHIMPGMTLEYLFCGQPLLLHSSGAAFLTKSRTLIVADLHFEKGSSYVAKGTLLPPYDTRRTLESLGGAIRAFTPKRIVCLGDSFHDGEAFARLHQDDAARLAELTDNVRWVWITGNHDPRVPKEIGGLITNEWSPDELTFRHIAHAATDPGEVSGHYHPKAVVRTRSRTVSRRCFVTDARRLILPAFGAYTGGLNVMDNAIADLFRDTMETYVIGDSRVYRIPVKRLRPPRAELTESRHPLMRSS